MVERVLTFAVDRSCNYRVEVRSALNNEMILSVDEDENFGEFLIKQRNAFTFHYYNVITRASRSPVKPYSLLSWS
jgi:hypothetical protein